MRDQNSELQDKVETSSGKKQSPSDEKMPRIPKPENVKPSRRSSLFDKNIPSLRWKKFRGGHVHSIIKRKRVSDEKLKKQYPEVRSDFYLDVYDKSIIGIK